MSAYLRPEESPADPTQLATLWTMFQNASAVPGPEYGSSAWLALAEDDPARAASTERAAFCWWAAGHGLGTPVPAEHLDAVVEQRVAEELRAASHAVAGARDWHRVGSDLVHSRAVTRARAEREAGR